MSSLRSFLDSHRIKDGTDWNLTGMGKQDTGKYKVDDDEYDAFLSLLNQHIFGSTPRASSLLERHREIGPPLVDLDLRYEMGGPLVRRFTDTNVRDFIAEYAASMIYLSEVEKLETDLVFYHLEKPAPETDKSAHKDGVHIQCPTLTLPPKYQYGVRGFLLSRDIIPRIFGPTGVSNPAEDCYDVSVISRNNWFFYGACKPDKAQYKVAKVWRVSIKDIRIVLCNGCSRREESDDPCICTTHGSPTDFHELTEIIKDLMTSEDSTMDTLDTMKTLSIRRSHATVTPLPIRAIRASEWEELMIHWGSGKAKLERAGPVLRLADVDAVGGGAGSDGAGGFGGAGFGGDTEETRRVTSSYSASDIALAYRYCKEVINAERRVGEYQDWVNLAICLKNISNTEESFKVWCEVTRRAGPSHKKSLYSETELRVKWNLIRIDTSRKLGMGSMQRWAHEDNPDKRRGILSESHSTWIINFGKDTHVNVASFVCKMYGDEFRCSVGSRKGAFEWYMFSDGSSAWKHMRTNTELRARLSGYVKNEYVAAGSELSRLHNAPENIDNTAERERLDDKRKKLFTIERQLEMSSFKDNVMRECQEKFYDEEFINKLNANPYTVGVSNGVLELRHYEDETCAGKPRVVFRAGLPDDNISFLMGRCDPDLEPIQYVPYDPANLQIRELHAFFERIYPDPVLRKYMLTLLASCLEGTNKEQRFYVMQGVGSNGKSMIEILMELTFGDYGTSMSTTVFTRKRPDSGAANPDLVTVKCRRYIHMGEPDDNEKINTSIMKQYSGGDRIQGRALFSDQEKFTIMGKIFMSCNDLPAVSKMDNGTWRRLRVIPHVSVFKDPGDAAIDPSKNIYEKDLDLENKLRHWRTAFLSMLVYYYETEYLVNGLKEPECVNAASNKYKEENDMFMSFFVECFAKEAGAGPVQAKEVKIIFREWRRSQGKLCELKEHQVLERMKLVCGSGSTEKEFWGIHILDETEDISGGLIRHMP